MSHSRAVASCEREAKKNAAPFEARTTPILFQYSLFCSGREVESVRDGLDQNSVFDFAERIWNGCPITGVIRRNEVADALEPTQQLAEQNHRLANSSDSLYGDETCSVSSSK